MKKTKTIQQWIIKSVFFLGLAGCYETASEKTLERGNQLFLQNKIAEAEIEYRKVFDEGSEKELVLESAKKLYEISYFKTKNYKQATRYLDRIIANSPSFGEAIEALKQKAEIEHKSLLQYEAAIKSYSRLLSHSGLSLDEENEFRLNLVKCLFAISKFEQAKTELKPLFEVSRPLETRMAAKTMEASIFQAEGQLDQAIQSYLQALDFAPTDKDKQDTLINIAMCYEQKEQYAKALESLNRIKSDAGFLEEKRKQLERLAKFKDRRLNR